MSGLLGHKSAITVLASLILTSATIAFAKLPEQARNDATLILAGHRDSRERLRSGVCHATGTRHYISKRHGFETDVEVAIFCAFDNDRSLVRFDRTEPPFNPQTASDAMGGKFIRTPDRVIQRRDGEMDISVQPSDTKPLGGIYPFDIRGVGSLNLRELEYGTTFERAFGQNGFLSDDKLTEAVNESGEVYRLSWSLADGRAVRKMWFDAARGYSPIRLEDFDGNGRRHARPTHVVEVTWVENSGAWVPTATRIEEFLSVPGNTAEVSESRRYSLTFLWESVNSPISDRLFTEEGLEQTRNEAVVVVDSRLGGTPIVVKQPAYRPADPVVPPEGWSARRLSVAIAMGIILAMVFALVLRLLIVSHRSEK